jgi:hypothetical protein
MTGQGITRVTTLLAAAIPAAVTLGFVLLYGKSYPVWETWYFIPVWEAFLIGGNWIAGLMESRWGHIHLLPNAINLFVGYLSNFNMMADLIVLWVTAILAFLIFLRFLPPNPLLIAAAATAFFSMRVAEVWLNGWDLMFPLSVLLASVMAWMLSGPITVARTVGALVIGLAAVLTAGQGVACIVAGTSVLIFRSVWEPKARLMVVLWIAGSALILVAFTSLRPDSSGVLNNLGVMTLASMLALLGNLIVPFESLLAGATVVFVTVVAMVWVMAARKALHPSVLFWFFMAVNVFGVCGLVALARSGDGFPLHARYIQLNTPLLIGVAGVLTLLWPSSHLWRAAGSAALIVWLVSAGVMSVKFAKMINGWDAHPAALRDMTMRIPLAVTPGQFIGVAASDPHLVARGLETMKRLGVNMFSDLGDTYTASFNTRPVVGNTDQISLSIEAVQKDDSGNIRISGTAFDPRTGRAPSLIAAQIDGSWLETAVAAMPSAAFARRIKAPAAGNAGWLIIIPESQVRRLEGKTMTVRAFGYDGLVREITVVPPR